MNNLLKNYSLLAIFIGFTSCSNEEISQTVGVLPDETAMSDIGGHLYSNRTMSDKATIKFYEGDAAAVEDICFALTKPATADIEVKAVTNSDLVAIYNEEHNTKLEIFPPENISFENNGILTLSKGRKKSVPITMTVAPTGLDGETTYLLAVSLQKSDNDVDIQNKQQTLFYRVNLRKKKNTTVMNEGVKKIPPLLPNATTVFYVNTETYKPTVVGAIGTYRDEWGGETLYYSLGNIVNLKRSTIDYDVVSQKTSLALGNDLSYILENRDQYVRHLQEYGRKVCLCIENGGKGVGFCNMSDMQIASFVKEVKSVVERYHLDGVNLWDEDEKYKSEGMPQLTKTSYPKLIKAIREAMPDKLLTLVDKGNATEYFYDSSLCGGIEVGKYIDYAWHGYINQKEPLQIINPNPEGSAQEYSQYTRKSISGLEESKYGSVVFPFIINHNSGARMLAQENMLKWKTQNQKKSDILVFGFDMLAQEYQEKEGALRAILEIAIDSFMDDGTLWDFDWDDYWFTDVFYGPIWLDKQAGMPVNNGYQKDW